MVSDGKWSLSLGLSLDGPHPSVIQISISKTSVLLTAPNEIDLPGIAPSYSQADSDDIIGTLKIY